MRLQNGEMLQRPLDLFDKAPVQKITVQRRRPLWSSRRMRTSAPRRREGAARYCDWSNHARPPPPLWKSRRHRREQPTMAKLRSRSLVDCAAFGARGRRYVQEQLRSRCSTGGALRDLRARQLLAIFVRSCGSANRGSDVLSVQSAYAACLLRVLKHDAPYPEAWSPTEPLGAQGASGERRDWAIPM